MLSRRWLNLLGLLICAGLLGYGYYLEYVEGLIPCPLCMFQRLAIYALGAVFLLAALHNPGGGGRIGYALLTLVAAGAGAALSMRHLWLQSLPEDEVPECGPDLDMMLDVFPLKDVILTVLSGDGSCADVSWTFLGLSLPGWTLVWFVILGVAGVANNWRR